MEKNLVQINNIFKAYASDHKVLVSYYDGLDKPSAEDHLYPMMIVEIGDSRMRIGSISTSYSIYFLDKLNEGGTNHLELRNKMLIQVENFFTMFNEMDWCGDKIFSQDDFIARPVKIANVDGAIGYEATFTIVTPMSLYRNNVPIT